MFLNEYCFLTQNLTLPIAVLPIFFIFFRFKKIKDIRKEITNSYKVVGNDPKIRIRISPMYGDEAQSFEISSDTILSPEPNISCIDYTIEPPRQASVSSSSTIAVGKSKRDGRVTHIINPVKFYVQNDDAIKDIRKRLADIDGHSCHVASVKINEMYAVCQPNTMLWHRGIVREELKTSKTAKDIENMKYKIFLLDYGVFEDHPKQLLRIIPEQLRAIPAAAVACRLVDISPAGEDWPKEARVLMEEIIQKYLYFIFYCYFIVFYLFSLFIVNQFK